MIQRVLDIAFSFIALVLLSPLFLIIIIILRFTGEGEIFFLQKRVGRKKNIFNLFKFATMLKNSENIGTGTITVNNDVRILPFGKVLRKTKINELPQLLNIFLGDMSLVGPRPLTTETYSFYSPEVQQALFDIRPGLSGIGSIIFRDEERFLSGREEDSKQFYKDVIAPYKGNLEIWYVENLSVLTYFKVIVVTIWIVVFPKSVFYKKIFRNLPAASKELIIHLN
jgi:lipopolysaccharide/colanic/teichoic acid biosynthesis glycosyltransferase